LLLGVTTLSFFSFVAHPLKREMAREVVKSIIIAFFMVFLFLIIY